MESKIISNNLLVQTTDLDEFNKSLFMFGYKPYGFISTGNSNPHVFNLINPTFAVTTENSSFLRQKGRLHLRKGLSTEDLNKVIKDYE